MVVSVRLLGVGQGGVRAVRRDAGEIRLTDRDLWALRWIGERAEGKEPFLLIID